MDVTLSVHILTTKYTFQAWSPYYEIEKKNKQETWKLMEIYFKRKWALHKEGYWTTTKAILHHVLKLKDVS